MTNRSMINRGVINASSFFETGSGSLIAIEQVVSLNNVGEGSLIAVEQSVYASGSGSVISLPQIVRSAGTFATRNGWYCYLYIGGYRIPDTQIHGEITITRSENDAALMSFTLIPPRGSIDLSLYEGKSVILNIEVDGEIYRAYTGKVNIPDLDLNSRKLFISCTDNRKEQINSQMASSVSTIGYYSSNVFGPVTSVEKELEDRLTTVPYVVNLDVFGTPKTTYAFAKATADYTFDETDVYRDLGRDPHVVITPRSKIVNTVYIDYEYRYQRLYHKEIPYTWTASYGSNVCDFLKYGYSVAQRSMIDAAVNATGWPLRQAISYTPVFNSGFYNCPTSVGTATVGFSWIQTSYTTVARTEQYRDGSGTLQTRNVVDSNGNGVYDAVPTSTTDYSKYYCLGASWTLTKRWSQNIIEHYTCTVTAPQSTTRFGVVSENEVGSTDTQYDADTWENYTTWSSIPTDVTTYEGESIQDYYFNETANYIDYANAMRVLLNKAKTTILKSHRANRIVFNTFVAPYLDLHHTVQLTATSSEGVSIDGKGKVFALVHKLNPSTGECNTQVELALSLAEGAQAETTIALPARPDNTLVLESDTVALGSHFGLEPRDTWTGFIGNKYKTFYESGYIDHRKTTYPESFVVDTPAISSVYRENINLTQTATYNVAIIDDDLDVTL